MNKYIYLNLALSLLLGGLFVFNSVSKTSVGAIPALQVAQGGTGSTTLSGLLLGNGTSSVQSVGNNSTNWNTAYGWGNHATAGYSTQAYGSSTYAMLSSNYINQAYASSTYLPYANPTSSVNLGAYSLTTTGAVNMASTTISDTSYVNQVCFSGTGNCQTDIVSAGTNIDFFYHNQSSDIAGYERLRTYPNNGTEIAETATSASQSYGLIDPYVSTSTDIVLSGIPAGTWRFRSWANVDSNVGITKIVNRVYKRASTGAETLLFTATSSEMTTGLKEYLYNGISASTTFETTDRLVIKNYCWTDSGSTKTCTFYYDGADHYSYVSSPISIAELDFARKTSNETITGTWNFTTQPTINGYSNQAYGSSTYALLSDGYLRSSYASTTYQPIGTYITQAYASSSFASSSGATITGTTTMTNISFSGLLSQVSTTITAVFQKIKATLALIIPYDQNITDDGGFGIDSTTGQLRSRVGSATTTYPAYQFPAFTYATSSWAGTTTIPLGTAFQAENWSGVQCFTDTGTLNVSFNDGTNRMNMFNASTTVGTVSLGTNNTFTAAEKRYVDVGTPASSPTKISCTVKKSIDPD